MNKLEYKKSGKIDKVLVIMPLNSAYAARYFQISCLGCNRLGQCCPQEMNHTDCPVLYFINKNFSEKIIGLHHNRFESLIFMNFNKSNPFDKTYLNIVKETLNKEFKNPIR